LAAYYIMLSGLSACGLCLCVRNRSRLKDGIFLAISFVVLAGMSSMRYDVGYDYSYIYSPIYEQILADPQGAYFANHRWEPGFKLMLKILMLFTRNYHALFVVSGIITVALVLLFYWFHSPNPFISVFLFVTLSHYYTSLDFVRQMIAAAITMFAFPLLKKRNVLHIVGYFALVLLAATFHKSALILIPFFFINLIPLNKYVLAGYTVVTAVVYFNSHRILEFVTRYWYQSYSLQSKHMTSYFSPQFTIAVVVIFLILFLGAKKLRERDDKNYLYINYAFFAAFFVLMGTRHSIVDRLSMYFNLLAPVGIAIIVHRLAEKLKEERPSGYIKRYANRNAVMLALLLFVLCGGGLAIHHYALTMDHHGVVPYKIIWQQPWWKDYIVSLKQTDEEITEPIAEPEDVSALPLPPPTSSSAQDPHLDPLEKNVDEIESDAPIEVPMEVFLSR
jgi:hypothetical protein